MTHFYLATMEVVDTTSVNDFSPQDERRFTIISGPLESASEAQYEVPDFMPYYILRYEGTNCTGIVLVEYFNILWEKREPGTWSEASWWEPHNLDTIFEELMSDARIGRELRNLPRRTK